MLWEDKLRATSPKILPVLLHRLSGNNITRKGFGKGSGSAARRSCAEAHRYRQAAVGSEQERFCGRSEGEHTRRRDKGRKKGGKSIETIEQVEEEKSGARLVRGGW